MWKAAFCAPHGLRSGRNTEGASWGIGGPPPSTLRLVQSKDELMVLAQTCKALPLFVSMKKGRLSSNGPRRPWRHERRSNPRALGSDSGVSRGCCRTAGGGRRWSRPHRCRLQRSPSAPASAAVPTPRCRDARARQLPRSLTVISSVPLSHTPETRKVASPAGRRAGSRSCRPRRRRRARHRPPRRRRRCRSATGSATGAGGPAREDRREPRARIPVPPEARVGGDWYDVVRLSTDASNPIFTPCKTGLELEGRHGGRRNLGACPVA